MNTQLRWIAAAVAALAVGQVSAQGYYGNPNYATGNGYGSGYPHVVRCESYNGRSNFCPLNARGRVFIARQLSQRQCIRGRNWNADVRGIWVGGGCRADFAIAPRRGYGQGGGYAAQGGYGGAGYGMNGGRGMNGDPGYMNNGAGPNAYRGDPNRDAGYNDPRYGNNDPRYANSDPRYGNNDPRYGNSDPRYGNGDPRYGNNDPRYGNNNSRMPPNAPYDDRDGDQDAGAPPDDPGYNQPQH